MSVHEECGVFGIWQKETGIVALDTYYALYALQHRGQESCGIAVCDDGVFRDYKDVGLVGTVFTPEILNSLGTGNMAIGHTPLWYHRRQWCGQCQPIVVNHFKGHMALAHNGNLVNAFALRRELEQQGSIFHMTSDSEVIAYVVTRSGCKRLPLRRR